MSRKRSGVTMIETLIALGLLITMFTLWEPVIAIMGKMTWVDAELLSVSTFQQAVQNQVAADETLTIDDNQLVIAPGSRDKTVERYTNDTEKMLRFATKESGGHEPLLLNVAAIKWQAAPHAVKYHLTMVSGRIYEGVIVDGTKTW
ncbi:competence type IV pilus minor pilin ComGF [Lacticaseibacillus porcinae]|uniref:competence type IV pilus minor pilin ComGF n=1 Tax=Lacticaseibacillus porcinae TaxID=1123687 RepID=UPI000F767E58|nr:competence type IV pilus minor pilin ComGF [Lacticaseibacillus porcinae]